MKENKANVNNNNLSIYKTIFVSLIFILIGISLFILWARHELLFGLFPGIFFILLGTFLYTHGLAIIKKKTLSSKIPKVISISFIIVILITSTLIWVYTEQDYIYKYKIEINPTNNESFSVILPIPIFSDGTPSDIMINIEIMEGKCDFKIDETPYGKGLNLTGNGKIVLESKGKTYSECYDNLSLWAQKNGYQIWIFSNKSNTTDIDFKVNSRCDRHHGISKDIESKVEGTIIDNGWKKYNGYDLTSTV